VEFGADHVFDARKYSLDRLRNINDNRLADAVIVCASADQAVSHALSSVDRKGKILFFAVSESDIPLQGMKFWRDEISMFFSYGASPDDLKKAIELIEEGLVNVRKMITHKVPLSDIMHGFKLVSEAKASLKVIVVPDPVQR
jgi:L-iditol 2-dehydrogenase